MYKFPTPIGQLDVLTFCCFYFFTFFKQLQIYFFKSNKIQTNFKKIYI